MSETRAPRKGGEKSTGAKSGGVLSVARKAVVNGALLVASLTIGALLAEGLVRVLAPQQVIIKRPDIWRGSDSLGWTHRPNVNTTLNTGERTVRVYTDSLGRRVGAGNRANRAGSARRILFLGDSYTEAFQVAYEDSFAGILESELSREFEEGVYVVNTAVGGWGPPQYLREARASLDRRTYDLSVVFLYLGNDVVARRPVSIPRRTPTEVHHLRWLDELTYEEVIDAWLYPINDFLEVRSEAFILFKRSASQILRKLDLTAGYFPDVFLRQTLSSDRWAVTGEICRDIANLAQKHGVPVLFVIVPTSYQVDEDAFWAAVEGFDIKRDQVVTDLGAPNRRLAAALRERGLRVIDLLESFRKAKSEDQNLYGSVDAHLSPTGHRVLARAVQTEFVNVLASDTVGHGHE